MWKLIIIILVVLYVLNPFDLLPDLLVGWGWLDDAAIIGILLRYFYIRKKQQEAFQKYHQESQNADDRYNERDGNHQHRTHGPDGESSSPRRDPFEILGIERGASQARIKQAYRQLAGKYHPDKVEHLGDEFKVLAERRFKEIQKAYEELKRE
jgi:DnaJ like chaperone protein